MRLCLLKGDSVYLLLGPSPHGQSCKRPFSRAGGLARGHFWGMSPGKYAPMPPLPTVEV